MAKTFEYLCEKLKEARTLADELASEQGLDIQITMTVKPEKEEPTDYCFLGTNCTKNQ